MWQQAFRAFRYRNYRLFFWGQIASMMGSWMQQVAIAWIVYEKTGSALLLGTLSTASLLPGLFIGPMAGVAADRWERRKILRWANIGFMIQAVLLFGFYVNDLLEVPVLIALAVLLGVAQGFDWPVRQSLVTSLVDRREDVGNAIALNSTTWNLARLVGPLIGGLLVGLGMIEICFLLNVIGSWWAWYSIGKLDLPQRNRTAPIRSAWVELSEGIRYAASNPVVRSCIAMPAVSSIFVLPYSAMLPIVASEWLNGGAKLYGILSAAPAIGAIAGGMFLATRPDHHDLPRIIRASGLLIALTLMAFTLSRTIPVALILLAMLGLFFILQISSTNTVLQMHLEEDMRGRTMALFTAVFTGSFPVGLMVCGALADVYGAAPVLFTSSIISAILVAWITASSFWRTKGREVAS